MVDFLLSYEALRVTWWVLLGVLLIGFAAMDGFDMGVGALLPFVARTDLERRVAINTVGPVWEGNQVWLILGGGAIFAAWPALYALSFSGFYLAMFLVLLALILRPVAFKTLGDWGVFPNLYAPNDRTEAFLEDVLSEVMALFPGPYIHVTRYRLSTANENRALHNQAIR